MTETTELYHPTFDVGVEQLKELLQEPTSFSFHGQNDELFYTWSLGPVVDMRGGGNLMASNARVLLERLKGYEADWRIVRCSHWGYGWVEHLTFRAREEPPDLAEIDRRLAEIDLRFVEQAERELHFRAHGPADHQSVDDWTRAFQAVESALLAEQQALLSQKRRLEYVPTTVCRIVCEWAAEIDDHGVLDESDLSERELEATLENLESIARDVRDDVPEGWVRQLHRWLTANHPSEMDSQNFEGAWPDRKIVQQGLAALGYLEEEDAEV